MAWADHFSATAGDYHRYRPIYPDALFAYLSTLAPSNEWVWDCATGNGQAAFGLSPHFETVVATDASFQQLAQSPSRQNVRFLACRAEAAPLNANRFSLVTIAQALHWFAEDGFFEEVVRVSTNGAIVAAWSYRLASIDLDIDTVLTQFYDDIGPYWPAERCYVAAAYATLPFPFSELTPPAFTMTALWTLDHLMGYVATWSAVKRARRATKVDPLPELLTKLQSVWQEPHVARQVSWPLRIRIGQVTK